MDAYNKRPRKVFIGATAREYILSRYLEDWRMKVEKVGNLNYPEEAKRQKLYGSLKLTVEINADGSVRNIELNRSSGHKELDQAALRIVRLAAPYAPFSADIRDKYDVVSITRTWMFTKSDELHSQ
jgi:protein TonB